MKNNIELLAPAGNFESAVIAINAGADAVYLGGDKFGARAGAENLSTEEIISIIKYAHIHDRKIYLTVNTLLKDREIEKELYDFIAPLYEKGLDAIIVQDIGVFLYIKNVFPQIHLHCSTQMTIFGEKTARYLHELGASRIVTPRELSLNEISNIHNTEGLEGLEIESFVHGALCYCYSGQCFLSSYIGGRSGNRGRCAQPCRMEYNVVKDGRYLNKKNEKYILSPKDICTLNILPEIIEAGVSSLKIEGRMKKTEYIAGVVSIYRKYIDIYLREEKYIVNPKDIQLLMDLFNRNGFNQSYYKCHNGRDMISLKKPSFRKENKEFTDNLKRRYFDTSLKKLLEISVKFKKNEPFLIGTNIDNENFEIEGEIPQDALKKPIDEQTLSKQLSKMGNTNFEIASIKCEIDDGLFLPIGAINNLRREFATALEEAIVSKYYRNIVAREYIIKENEKNQLFITAVCVCDLEQLKAALKYDFVGRIYIDVSNMPVKKVYQAIEDCRKNQKEVYIAMPYVFRMKDQAFFDKNYKECLKNADGVLIRNIEQYFYIKNQNFAIKSVFDYNVYTSNKYAKDCYNGMGINVTCPLELNYSELKTRGCLGDEFIVYGYMPVMISAGCALKTTQACNKNNSKYVLKDRMGNEFYVNCVCNYCYNIMYNCKPLSLIKFRDEIEQLQVSTIRLSFTNENYDQTLKVLHDFDEGYNKGNYIEDDSTRGHFKRGVK